MLLGCPKCPIIWERERGSFGDSNAHEKWNVAQEPHAFTLQLIWLPSILLSLSLSTPNFPLRWIWYPCFLPTPRPFFLGNAFKLNLHHFFVQRRHFVTFFPSSLLPLFTLPWLFHPQNWPLALIRINLAPIFSRGSKGKKNQGKIRPFVLLRNALCLTKWFCETSIIISNSVRFELFFKESVKECVLLQNHKQTLYSAKHSYNYLGVWWGAAILGVQRLLSLGAHTWHFITKSNCPE